jgi:iron(II)-dependent oxidoreductase
MTPDHLVQRLHDARAATLALVAGLDDPGLRAQPHRDFSPVGWHLGHLAFTEAYWVHGRCGGDDRLWKPFARAFSQGGRPKHRRCELPAKGELLAYLEQVRDRTVSYLDRVDGSTEAADPLQRDGYVAWLVECHEHQHRETISMLMGLADLQGRSSAAAPDDEAGAPGGGPTEGDAAAGAGAAPGDPAARHQGEPPPMVAVPGGEFLMGTDAHLAYDNERRSHRAACGDFRLDAHPVTAAAWMAFMADGGYRDPRLWTEAGWCWRQQLGVAHPLGWRFRDDRWVRRRLDGVAPIDGREPVCGVSWYEANAFARWRGARLPTEVEWERAAALHAAVDPEQPTDAALDLAGSGPRPVAADGGSGGLTSPSAAGATPTPSDLSALSDLLGNVWEWTGSAFAPYPGFEPFPYRGYSAPYFGDHRVLRGGSFATSPVIARPSFRNWYLPHIREVFAGLRCAEDG